LDSLYGIHHTLKGKGFIGRHFGQYFAIELDIASRQGRNKSRVAKLVLSYSRLNPLNPELAPLALFVPTITKAVLPGLFDAANGNPKAIFRPSSIAFAKFQKILVLRQKTVMYSERSRHGRKTHENATAPPHANLPSYSQTTGRSWCAMVSTAASLKQKLKRARRTDERE
jgi:hypothetical protein